MAGNHVLLETIQLTQSASSVTFDNIPQTGYTDLKIVISARKDTSGVDAFTLSINGGTTAISANKYLDSGAGTPRSGSVNFYQGLMEPSDYTANTFASAELYIPNYNSTTASKSISGHSVLENNATASYGGFTASLWPSNSSITSLTFTNPSGNFVANSTFSLYGIAATGTTPVTAPLATGGNIVATDGTYWYHAFTTSGNFIPQTPITCDAIVVGAGGGGGSDVGGGGGAGRVYALSTLSLTQSTNYTCTIGAGGTGTNPHAGIKGSDSTFTGGGLSYLSLGGGGGNGRSYGLRAPNDGWNGGGGGYDAAFGATAGNGGNAGGATTNPGSNPTYCGGGGGASEVGNADGTAQGGDGTTTYASWLTAINAGVSNGSTLLIAGGGGGGMYGSSSSNALGGDGGGGFGGDNDQGGGNGTASTGSGGGGGGSSQNGGIGGSGLIIIRYLVA